MSEPNKDSLLIRISKITVKALGLILVFGTIFFFIWRAFISTIVPAEVNGLAMNDALYDAYQAAEAAGKTLTIFSQEQGEITAVEYVEIRGGQEHSEYSYFGAQNVSFIQEANQVQVLFRYNNGALRNLKKPFGLTEDPDRHVDQFDVTLVVAYDLTPDDESDNLKSEPGSVELKRYHASSSEPAETLLYNYRRLTFDGIDMTVTENPVLAVYVDVYYLGALDYDKEPYGTLCIYDYITEKQYADLTKKEREALENYK